MRECYGSYSIKKARENGFKMPPYWVALSKNRVYNLADIRKALIKAEYKEEMYIKKTVNAFIREKFTVETEEKAAGFNVETLTTLQFKGQMVRKNNIPLMFSFVKTKSRLTDSNQERLARAKTFRM